LVTLNNLLMQLNQQWLKSLWVILLLTVLIIKIQPLGSNFWNNIGWIIITKSLVQDNTKSKSALAQQATGIFSRAVALAPVKAEAYRGLGYSYLELENLPLAVENFRKARINTSKLLERSQLAMTVDNFSEAIIWTYITYLLEQKVDRAKAIEAFHKMGWACRRQGSSLESQKGLVKDACQHYLDQTNQNLIVNGEFEGGHIGWAQYQTSPESSEFFIDVSPRCKDECACILGKSEAYHGGWFQNIYLPSDASIHYSFLIKSDGSDDLEVRLLYWEFKEDGQIYGSKTQKIVGSMDWTHVETSITISETDDQFIRFFPVLVTGKGTVCVDSVYVKIATGGRVS